jgi:hypothetical protein
MVEQVPLDRVQTDWLKLPVLLLVLQVTVPVGLDPETVTVHVTDEPTWAGFGEHVTDIED